MSTDHPVCGAKTRTGGTCQLRPLTGATRCRKHGGASPAAQRKAKERLALAQLEKDMRLLGIRDEYDQVDPTEQMLRVLAATAAEERYLATRVAELTGEDGVLTWQRTQRQDGTEKGMPTDLDTSAATPHVLVAQLRDCRDRLIRYASTCVKAGIEERRMALAEGQADQLVGSFLRAIAAVTLTTEQRDQLQAAFVQELRALEPGVPA